MQHKTGTILIVDDEVRNRDLLEALLLPQGYNVIQADSGEKALRLAKNELPDVILLDIMMPGVDGYDVLKSLKADILTMDIPVIFITALFEVGHETKGLELGAIDYITKPISKPIVLARLKNHLNLKLAQETLKNSHKRIAEELFLAKRLQESLLPQSGIASAHEMDGLSIFGFTRPASEVNGDFFSYKNSDTNKISICLADCKGHGVSAGMMTMAVYSLMRMIPDTASSAREAMNFMARKVKEVCPSSEFAGMMYLLYDRDQKTARISSAGMPFPILYNAGKNRADELTLLGGPPLGLPYSPTAYEENEFILKPGDKLVMFSDGLTEAINPAGDFFGIPNNGLMEIINQHGKKLVDDLGSAITESWEKFYDGSQTDDCTLLVISPSG